MLVCVFSALSCLKQCLWIATLIELEVQDPNISPLPFSCKHCISLQCTLVDTFILRHLFWLKITLLRTEFTSLLVKTAHCVTVVTLIKTQPLVFVGNPSFFLFSYSISAHFCFWLTDRSFHWLPHAISLTVTTEMNLMFFLVTNSHLPVHIFKLG